MQEAKTRSPACNHLSSEAICEWTLAIAFTQDAAQQKKPRPAPSEGRARRSPTRLTTPPTEIKSENVLFPRRVAIMSPELGRGSRSLSRPPERPPAATAGPRGSDAAGDVRDARPPLLAAKQIKKIVPALILTSFVPN